MENPILQQIDIAIGAHGTWKGRLRSAISTGRIDLPIDAICRDNQCEFGRWLYGAGIPVAQRATRHYTTVRERHAQFHAVAGEVAKLALARKRDEAEKLMALDGRFAAASAALTQAMVAWKKAVAGENQPMVKTV